MPYLHTSRRRAAAAAVGLVLRAADRALRVEAGGTEHASGISSSTRLAICQLHDRPEVKRRRCSLLARHAASIANGRPAAPGRLDRRTTRRIAHRSRGLRLGALALQLSQQISVRQLDAVGHARARVIAAFATLAARRVAVIPVVVAQLAEMPHLLAKIAQGLNRGILITNNIAHIFDTHARLRRRHSHRLGDLCCLGDLYLGVALLAHSRHILVHAKLARRANSKRARDFLVRFIVLRGFRMRFGAQPS